MLEHTNYEEHKYSRRLVHFIDDEEIPSPYRPETPVPQELVNVMYPPTKDKASLASLLKSSLS
jgi:hypothetical protein